MLTIESATAEKLQVEITTPGDPTGGVVDFALIVAGEPSVWVAGTWSGSWDPVTGRVLALTPLVGATGALPVVGGADYFLYSRWRVGVETPVATPTVVRVR